MPDLILLWAVAFSYSCEDGLINLQTKASIITNKIRVYTKANLSPMVSAKNPIRGGPTKNPEYPTVVAMAIPTPGATPGAFPAAEYTMGTTVDSPSPTRKIPNREM